ncbi:CBO0543 family protein [Rossellomorea sp. BNER]|uniref:CBO0543 family protein n=1 Tax=Rossellomorea sp. BNER TaxID=2962031 RepID=UPI003AF1EE26|nr:hypothetical protein [Rossellomorea sp. BNER]
MNHKYDQLNNQVVNITDQYIDYWLEYCFLSPKWWLLVVLFIVAWFVFIKLVNREKLPKLLFLGLLWIIISSNLDGYGYELGLWGYPVQISPFLAKAYLFDYAFVPVFYMLLYHYFPKGRRFFFANVILAAGASFIAEPIFIWLDIYKIYNWKTVYSFFIYIFLSYVIRAIVEKVFRENDS